MNEVFNSLPPVFSQPHPSLHEIPPPRPCPGFVEDIHHNCLTFSDDGADRLLRGHGEGGRGGEGEGREGEKREGGERERREREKGEGEIDRGVLSIPSLLVRERESDNVWFHGVCVSE